MSIAPPGVSPETWKEVHQTLPTFDQMKQKAKKKSSSRRLSTK